jgi:flagellar hook protein FlgE
MSLTGTLLSGVAGLKAQTNAMAILSDNISNINTIGYKKSLATFSTLVVNSAASTTYSPGGVKSGRFALIDNQGVLQASNRPLDIAISGNGFITVNSDGSGTGESLYTRAGQFHEDNQGRLVNSAGMYLMGWALDQNGAITNINQIEVASVGTLNGVAVDTTDVSIGANLDSTETAGTSTEAIFNSTASTTTAGAGYPGAGEIDTLATATSPSFRRAIQVFDSLGTAHNLSMTFDKLTGSANAWGFVLHAETPSEVEDILGVTSSGAAGENGVLGFGTLIFNGDGSLASVDSFGGSLNAALNATSPQQGFYTTPDPSTGTPQGIPISWTNGAAASVINFDFGTPGAIGTGLTDGITQFASDYNVAFINQNGSAVGLRTGVSIDKDGFVVASFSNGATQKIYQIPITTFADPTALESRNGNAFAQTVASGSFNWRIANTGGAGRIEPSSLESSNADLGDEFSNMIVTQRAYSANAKTISTADEMLEELLRIKR